MIDWEEIAGAVEADELKEAKLWLLEEGTCGISGKIR